MGRLWPLAFGPRFLLTFVVAAEFGAIAALGHVAPAAAMILAGIEKQPEAVLGGAGAYEVQLVGGKKIRSRTRNRPQRCLEMVERIVKLPAKSPACLNQLRMLGRVVHAAVQGGERSARHGLFIQDGPENFIHRFAQLDRSRQGRLRRFGRSLAAHNQSIGFKRFENPRVLGKMCEIDVRGEKFLRFIGEAIIERIDEVETQRVPSQIKPGRLASLDFSPAIDIGHQYPTLLSNR
jgi:hypothetical protein